MYNATLKKYAFVLMLFSILPYAQAHTLLPTNASEPPKLKKGFAVLPKLTPTSGQPVYEEEEDGVMPLSLVWQPGLNFVWNKDPSAAKIRRELMGSWNLSRVAVLYDFRLHKRSKFFVALGLAYSPLDLSIGGGKCIGRTEDEDKFGLHDATNYAPCPRCQKTERCSHRKSGNWKVDSVVLTARYVELLGEVKFRSDPTYKENFSLALGVKVGVCVSPQVVVKFPHTEDKQKEYISVRTKGMKLGLSAYRFGPYARISWGRVGLWGEWIITPLFKDKEVTNLAGKYTLSTGISFDIF